MREFLALDARARDLLLGCVCASFCAIGRIIARLLLWSCCLALSFGLFASPAIAAPDTRWAQADIVFQHLTTDNGLPQGTVTALAEDANGFLWVGTQGGLARWDGQRFHVYRFALSDPYSLPDGFVNCLYYDSAGNLWVGTNGGLARYLPDQDRFQIFSAGAGGLSHVAVIAITGDGKGGIWVGTEGGLDHIDAQQRVTAAPEWRSRLPNPRIFSLILSKDGALWVGTRKGLMRVAANGETRTIQFPSADETTPGVAILFQASDGKIWGGSRQYGVFWIDTELQIHAVTLPKEAAVDSVIAILEVMPGVLWLGSSGQGIVAVGANGEFLRQIRNDVRLPASLADNAIWCMLRDRSGLVWVGNGRGLSQHAQQQAVLTLFGVPGRTDGLTNSDILALASASDGRVWFSMGNNALAVLNPDTGRIEPVSIKGGGQPILATGPQGVVYVAFETGLYRTTGKGNELQAMRLPHATQAIRAHRNPSRPASPLSPKANLFEGVSVLLVEERVIWVGGTNGLWRLTLGPDGKILDGNSEAPGQWTDQRITVLRRATDGKLWVGTENGLNLLDPETHTVERILPNRADVKALAAGSVSSLLIDRKKRLWVASSGGGISLLEGRNDEGRFQFRRFGLEQGLPTMIVIKLLQDAKGTIWGSTEEGLISIDPDSLRIRAFRRGDGVAINSYWVDSGTVTQKGEILFGGAGGLTVVIPQRVQSTQFQAPVVVTDARIGGNSVPIGLLNTGNPSVLTLTPKTNSLALEFAALDYSAPERNRYAYRLDGYDSNWIETDASRRLASYANLAPGEYRLELRGSNRDGMFSNQTRALTVRVLPAWYQTWWWRILVALASFMLIAGVIQGRTRYLRHRQFELQSQVRFRTSELRQKQSELLNANAELAQTADILRLMGDVGRDITANLEQIQVFEALYHHVGGLLDVVGMTIYRINLERETLDCCFAREQGRDMPLPMIPLDSPTSSAARAVRERRGVLLTFPEDALADDIPDQVPDSLTMRSSVFEPLIVGQRVLGAMSVQSTRVHAYGERERLIFRTVCAYGAIALSNAEALDALHEAQRQLLQQEKMASLGGLVSGVAHEVNTPLGNTLVAISGTIGILRNQQKALNDSRLSLVQLEEYTTEGLAYAELAQLTALRVAEMMNSFKAIATHSGVDQRHEVKLALYMPDVVALVRPTLERAGCQTVVEVESDLIVRIVPEALTEALARILSNVIHHAFVERDGGEVRVTARRDFDGGILIEVSDNGCGISEHDLPKVFDPFFTTKSGIGGHVGLGLHIAYNHITQRLNSTVTIASVVGQGTTVTIRLPLSCCE